MQHNRQIALQIAAQLPTNPKDALEVLVLAQEIVEKFFVARQPERGSFSGGSKPRLRAISGVDKP